MRTRRSLVVLVLVTACGSSPPAVMPTPTPTSPATIAEPAATPAPRDPGVKRYDAATLFKNVGVIAAGFSHDGTRILCRAIDGRVQCVRATRRGRGARRTDEVDDGLELRGQLFSSRRPLPLQRGRGRQRADAHLRFRRQGDAKDLTPGDKVKAQFQGWSKDQKAFCVSTNERDPKFFDLYRYAANGYQRERVFTNEAASSIGDVSRRWSLARARRRVVDQRRLELYIPTSQEAGARRSSSRRTRASPEPSVRVHARRQAAPVTRPTGRASSPRPGRTISVTGKASCRDCRELGRRVRRILRARPVSRHPRPTRTRQRPANPTRMADTSRPARTCATRAAQCRRHRHVLPRDETQMGFLLDERSFAADLWIVDRRGRHAAAASHALNPAVDLPAIWPTRRSSATRAMTASRFRRSLQAPRTPPRPTGAGGGAGPRRPRRASRAAATRELVQYLVNHGYAVLAVNNRGSSRLRQDVLPPGRPEAWRRRPQGLRRGASPTSRARLGRPEPRRHHRRQLRRLHGRRGARVRGPTRSTPASTSSA